MSETPVTTIDLVNQALEGNPTKLGATFNDLIMPRVHDAVQAKKLELSRTMFEPVEDEEVEQEPQDQETVDQTEDQQPENTEDEEQEDENTETDA